MLYYMKAACLCNTGKIRSNNEDNFCFRGRTLPEENDGLTRPMRQGGWLKKPRLAAVFDGMGGEQHGEAASFTAAWTVAETLLPKQDAEGWMDALCQDVNEQVFQRAQSFFTRHMGSTMAMLYFYDTQVTVCNLGDSRIFRLRDRALTQLSVDHTDEKSLRQRGLNRKPQLTQHLGIDPEEMRIVPHIMTHTIACDDRYLICSDGLTDMVTQDRICQIMRDIRQPAACAKALVQEALDNGGRDNVTVIVCGIY